MHFGVSIDIRIQHINMPENLAVGMMVREQRNKWRNLERSFDCLAFAFGEPPFQVPSEASKALTENSAAGGYTEPGGVKQLKIAAADFYKSHFGLNVHADRVQTK